MGFLSWSLPVATHHLIHLKPQRLYQLDLRTNFRMLEQLLLPRIQISLPSYLKRLPMLKELLLTNCCLLLPHCKRPCYPQLWILKRPSQSPLQLLRQLHKPWLLCQPRPLQLPRLKRPRLGLSLTLTLRTHLHNLLLPHRLIFPINQSPQLHLRLQLPPTSPLVPYVFILFVRSLPLDSSLLRR